MEDRLNINWYPGHMKKTKDLLKQNMSLVDIVVEIVDSRVPNASKNPDIDYLSKGKQRIIVLNKEDLSEPSETTKWINYYKSIGYTAISFNSNDNSGLDKINNAINTAFLPIKEKLNNKGILDRAPRIMIVGVPNSGKSSFINKLYGKKTAQTGDRPGVTKGKQWVRLRGNIEMLDTPGILWPKFEDENVAKMLAYTGAIKDDILNIEDICFDLIKYLLILNPDVIPLRYGIEIDVEDTALGIMNKIALGRGFIKKGSEIDYLRLSKTILNEFRGGLLGRITLEKCSY